MSGDPAVPALVLRTAGTNCDAETVRALELAGARPELLHWKEAARRRDGLEGYGIVALPGGFSYGDYLAAGRVFGAELRAHMRDALVRFVDRGGLVIGICNGFQVLVELGMFAAEGLAPGERSVALTDNASGRFECRWVTLRSERSACSWLVPGDLTPMPVAHAEGRFVVRDPEVLAQLRERGQIALTYSRPDGGAPGYPENPNGSAGDVAGICDETGRILGLMPHPERNVTPWNRPGWTRLPERTEGEGLALFRRMVALAAGAPLSSRS